VVREAKPWSGNQLSDPRLVRAIGDINSDGIPDFAASSFGMVGEAARVLVCSGADAQALRGYTGALIEDLGGAVAALGDINGDGVVDFGLTVRNLSTPQAPRYRVYDGATGADLYEVFGESDSSTIGIAAIPTGVDFDGDGGADYVITDPSPSGTQPGWVALRSGRTGAVLQIASGASAGESFGRAAVLLGDITSDGLPEIALVSSSFGGFGRIQIREAATLGLVREWSDSVIGLPSTFGRSMAALPDQSGDGLPEIAVGIPNAGAGVVADLPGFVRIYSSANGSLLASHAGPQIASGFGHDIAATADFSGNGLADLLVAARADATAAWSGAVLVVNGLSGATAASLFPTYPGAWSASDEIGLSVADVGDQDLDGKPELAAVIRSKRGGIFVVSGATLAPRFGVGPERPEFGSSVAPLGDVTGDGIVDLAIASRSDGSIAFLGGSVSIHSGDTADPVRLFQGAEPQAAFGTSMASAGDVDGDGLNDLLVGAPQTIVLPGVGSGKASVYSSATGAVLRSWTSAQLQDGFGYSVSSGGDHNSDGFPEIVVGAPSRGFFVASGVGRADVFDGATGTPIASHADTVTGSKLGARVASVGDVNLDGITDYAVGTGGLPIFETGGYVDVYSGASHGILGRILAPPFSIGFGTAVAGVGDLDVDGSADLAVGTPQFSASGSSSVRVFSGRTLLLIRNWTAPGNQGLGCGISPAGDFDLDGVPDVAVSGQSSALHTATVQIYSGLTGVVASGTSFSESALLEAPLCNAGDVNQDGLLDLCIGRPLRGDAAWLSMRPISTESIGTGTAGCLGPQVIGVNGPPAIGNAAFELRASGAPAGTLGACIVTDLESRLGIDPFALGISMHVNVPGSSYVIPLDAPVGPGGFASTHIPLPFDSTLVGRVAFAQMLFVWPSTQCAPSPFGISATPALRFAPTPP